MSVAGKAIIPKHYITPLFALLKWRRVPAPTGTAREKPEALWPLACFQSSSLPWKLSPWTAGIVTFCFCVSLASSRWGSMVGGGPAASHDTQDKRDTTLLPLADQGQVPSGQASLSFLHRQCCSHCASVPYLHTAFCQGIPGTGVLPTVSLASGIPRFLLQRRSHWAATLRLRVRWSLETLSSKGSPSNLWLAWTPRVPAIPRLHLLRAKPNAWP